jgi:sialate O-acetylesterase
MMINLIRLFSVAAITALLTTALAFSSLAAAPATLPSVFGDHMVLQRDMPLPIWGRAEPGTQVTINLGEQTLTTAADATGAWTVRAAALPASAKPILFTITDAAGKVTSINDVLVGDVWLASGQSNMELVLKATRDVAAELTRADAPTIRLFQVRRLSANEAKFDCDAQWQRCTPDTANRFSAIAYYFARDIEADQHVPVGVIGSYASGTQIEPWISLDGFLHEPLLAKWADELHRQETDLPMLRERYTRQTVPAWQAKHDAWERDVAPQYREAMTAWNTAAAAARASGDHLPPKPKPASPEPKKPDLPTTNPHKFGSLYNGMIAPVVPYTIKGVIWYQGESNADAPGPYATLFPGLISDWRRQWAQPGEAGSLTRDFPFLFVQLANFVSYPNADWPGLRGAQASTLKVTHNTAIVVTIDVGGDEDLHYPNKVPVGHRLALAARAIAYGEVGVAYQGPTMASTHADGDSLSVVFDHVGTGLTTTRPASAGAISTKPTTAATKPASPTAPAAFAIAGENGECFPADAMLVSPDTVRLTCPSVTAPKYVRYAWENTPHVNLYNSDGLPAVPFRTDSFATGSKPMTQPSDGQTLPTKPDTQLPENQPAP